MTHHNVAHAVIGANFGDEGKGLATDAIAARLMSEGHDPLVVRSNGGAQAGHTVKTPDGRRHVFHHVGSGAFAGARTHLSRFFVAHPMLLLRELEELRPLMSAAPVISIDPRAQVTTPWDVFINQSAEAARGSGRHGSCGVGFGETLLRAERATPLSVADLTGPDLRGRLIGIRDDWAVARIEALGLNDHPSVLRHQEPLWSDALLDRFIEDVGLFSQLIAVRPDYEIGSETVLFEGAQGLMLDMDLGVMPHLTRSNTGLRNMITISEEAGISEIRPLYMTRAYMTRHGAGPLRYEQDRLPWAQVSDPTNQPNPWQGSMRTGPLDLFETADFIGRDLAAANRSRVTVAPQLGVSCLDQISGMAELRIGSDQARVSAAFLAEVAAAHMRIPLGLRSFGPTRGSVRVEGGDLSA